MEIYEQRVANGVLKSNLAESPSEVERLLGRDIEVIAPYERVVQNDLWPALWALSSVLERQFTGTIYLNVGLEKPLPQPARLSSRCIFGEPPKKAHLIISLGCVLDEDDFTIIGDARGSQISYGRTLAGGESAVPISCFAIAGYLGFAALAKAIGIPQYRREFAQKELMLPIPEKTPQVANLSVAFLGLGHLGNAYLSLLYFLKQHTELVGRAILLDGGYLEDGNWQTHILVEDSSKWIGESKSSYLTERLQRWGLDAKEEIVTLNWDWRCPSDHPTIALLGFDNFPARRMAAGAGYKWLVESGLGDSFLEPKLTWHSIPADAELAKTIFADRGHNAGQFPDGQFAQALRSKPGCGFLDYQQVHAAAPSMGLLASAFAWTELLRLQEGIGKPTRGAAALWSPILPFYREQI